MHDRTPSPDSRHSRRPGLPPRRSTRALVARDRALKVFGWACVLTVILAFLAAVSGWSFLTPMGAAVVAVAMLSAVVALVAAGVVVAMPASAAVRERHRAALRRARES